MSHNIEEQEMEAEALSAIFPDAFEVRQSSQPFVWSIKLVPVDTDGDAKRCEKENHVGVHLVATLPKDYPESATPEFDIEVLKGLADEQREILLEIAKTEAENNLGIPVVFACCEVVREWLVDNNVKGQDDGSMYAQMMRKAKEAEKEKKIAAKTFEAQKKSEEFSAAELEEMAVRKRRAEGTAVTKESFEAWRARFKKEEEAQSDVELNKSLDRQESTASSKKGKGAIMSKKALEEEMSKRPTGFELFSGKTGALAMEALEREMDAMEKDAENLRVDEELFEDDDDLDDLDFDSDQDDGSDLDDDDEDEPDI